VAGLLFKRLLSEIEEILSFYLSLLLLLALAGKDGKGRNIGFFLYH
jgi:hypothetical protein